MNNAEIISRAYEAFGKGDVPTVLQSLSDQITWHVPGRSPLSGDSGHEGVLEFFGKCMKLSAGTLKVEVDSLLADDDQVVALTTVSADRHGAYWSLPEVHVWQVAGGKAVSFVEFHGDQQTEDEFWFS